MDARTLIAFEAKIKHGYDYRYSKPSSNKVVSSVVDCTLENKRE
jgi:hypothetical protein